MTALSRNTLTNQRLPNQSSAAKPPKATYVSAFGMNAKSPPNPDSNPSNSAVASTRLPISLSAQDQYLSRSTHLTRCELIKRRSHNLKQLAKCYRNYYWALMEELKAQYREYYWTYGVSPFKEDQVHDSHQRRNDTGSEFIHCEGGADGPEGVEEDVGENNHSNGVIGGKFDNMRCNHAGCKLKAMALTSYCHVHILSDSKQKLYKPCGYVIKSAQAGNITCGKAILNAVNPPFCAIHFQKAQKHVFRALKKAGLAAPPANAHAPKLHVVVAEYVHQIQAKRRAVKRANASRVTVKETNIS